jgi:hypothetical protein
MFYKVKIKHLQLEEDNKKRSTTTLLIQTHETVGHFADAEKKANLWLAEQASIKSGSVYTIIPTNVIDTHDTDGNILFLVKGKFSETTDSGKEVFFVHEFVIGANESSEADKLFKSNFCGGMIDYSVSSISTTDIYEVIFCEKQEEQKPMEERKQQPDSFE